MNAIYKQLAIGFASVPNLCLVQKLMQTIYRRWLLHTYIFSTHTFYTFEVT